LVAKYEILLSYVDLFLLDIKGMEREHHRRVTGWDNVGIHAFARFLAERGKKMWIRYVLCPTITDGEEELLEASRFVGSLETVERVEVLPYHTLGKEKYERMGIPYPLEGIDPPDKETVERVKALFEDCLRK
jgi:pyruvate formate lyase activating enzyme